MTSYERAAETARKLRDMAKKYNITIVTAVQCPHEGDWIKREADIRRNRANQMCDGIIIDYIGLL